MDSFIYTKSYIKGLSPLNYQKKPQDFYKRRHLENFKPYNSPTEVESDFKHLTPSKWHVTGWKYEKLPEILKSESKANNDFTTAYTTFYQTPKITSKEKPIIPKNSYSRQYLRWSPIRINKNL